MTDDEADELQDRHMAYGADLQARGLVPEGYLAGLHLAPR
jgi:hypothetical protein